MIQEIANAAINNTSAAPVGESGVSLWIFIPMIPVAFIIGQFFILRCKNKRLGAILPFVWFCISIIISFYVASTEKNEAILSVFAFLALNIPTGIMLLMMYIKNGKEKVQQIENK